MNVILLDDDWQDAARIESLLKSAGLNVETFSNIEEFKNRWKKPTPIDLAIFDIELEEKQDGIEVAKELRETRKSAFMFVSKHGDDRSYMNRARNETMITSDFFLEKGILDDEDLFLEKVYACINTFRGNTDDNTKYLIYNDYKFIIEPEEGKTCIGKNDIAFFMAAGNYTTIYLTKNTGGRHIVTIKVRLGEFYLQLSNYFCCFKKIAKSHFINVEKLLKIDESKDDYILHFEGGEKFKIASHLVDRDLKDLYFVTKPNKT